jgi:glycosyltransferase domain-containing protein
LNKLHDVALIVPTRDRPDHVHRLLAYHAGSSDLQIVLGDGSRPENVTENRRIIDSFRGGRVDIIHYCDSQIEVGQNRLQEICGYFRRVAEAANLSSRPYIYIGADDDFVSPEFLSEATAFLDGNPDYSGVTGYLFSFGLDREGVAGNVVEKQFSALRSTARTEAGAVDRIAQHEATRATDLNYACVRRYAYDTISRAVTMLVERAQDQHDLTAPEVTTFTVLYVYELIADHVTLALGKVHWLPRVQRARHYHGNNLGPRLRSEYKVNLSDSFAATHWAVLVRFYIDAVVQTLIGKAGMEPSAARRVAVGALATRVGTKLSVEGKLRLLNEGANPDALPQRSRDSIGLDELRRLVRMVPGLRQLARAILSRIAKYGAPAPTLETLPSDVAALLNFLNQYRRPCGNNGILPSGKRPGADRRPQ